MSAVNHALIGQKGFITSRQALFDMTSCQHASTMLATSMHTASTTSRRCYLDAEQLPTSLDAEQLPTSLDAEQLPTSLDAEQLPTSAQRNPTPLPTLGAQQW
jgi:hypothetical protein